MGTIVHIKKQELLKMILKGQYFYDEHQYYAEELYKLCEIHANNQSGLIIGEDLNCFYTSSEGLEKLEELAKKNSLTKNLLWQDYYKSYIDPFGNLFFQKTERGEYWRSDLPEKFDETQIWN